MRLLVARCEVLYTGRLTARLPEAVRLLMFKADGSFLVHDDAGGFRPLNCIRTVLLAEASGLVSVVGSGGGRRGGRIRGQSVAKIAKEHTSASRYGAESVNP